MTQVSIHIAVSSPEEMIPALRRYEALPNIRHISVDVMPIDPVREGFHDTDPEARFIHDETDSTVPDAVKPAPEPAEETVKPDTAEPAHIYSEIEVRAAVAELRDSKGIDAVKAIFAKFGVTKFPELEPEQYTDVMIAVKEAMGNAC